MLIKNTTVEARFPWPADMLVQGGAHGTVFRRESNESYETAFCEAFPEHGFLRGEGPTVESAEEACWKKYLTYVYCEDKSRSHGPFEPRHLRNGSGFCTRCGTWFDSDVANCEEDEAHRQERIDFNDVTIEVLAEERWPPNQFQHEVIRRMRHRQEVRAAVDAGVKPPVFEHREPIDPEEFDRRATDEIEKLLQSLAGERRLSVEDRDGE